MLSSVQIHVTEYGVAETRLLEVTVGGFRIVWMLTTGGILHLQSITAI